MNRLSDKEAIDLLKHGDILELGQQANKIRQEKHPGNTVTFIVDRNINYTNVCLNDCRFCAFFRRENHKDAYLLPIETILQKVKETQEAGGTQIMLQGGLHPSLSFEYYLNMINTIKTAFPDIVIHSFSPAEILHFSKIANKSIKETLQDLRSAGLASLPGGGAEILVDRVRKIVSPKKIMTDDWLKVMETAHSIGMERHVRDLQDKTSGFRAFIMWTFQPGNTQLGGNKLSSWEYLKTLAVSRLYFDNISHIQGSWVTQGQQIGQITLAFGADDLGSIMLEENVVRAAGTAYQMSIDKMVTTIEKADFKAAQRDTEYNIIRRF